MKDVAAKLLLIAIIVFGIAQFIYGNQWENIKDVDAKATTQITNTSLPTNN